MGSLDDATANNLQDSAHFTYIRAESGNWDNASVNAASVSGIGAVANTNSSQSYGNPNSPAGGGKGLLAANALEGNYFGQTISYSSGTLTLARETYSFTVCDCDG